MKEELVSFETAKLAKEKGFPQDKYEYILFGDDGKNHTIAYFNISFPDANWYVQPTQSLLQHWLREEHKIHIIVEPAGELFDKFIWSVARTPEDMIKTEVWRLNTPYEYFNLTDTYEQSLEAGLKEALKMI